MDEARLLLLVAASAAIAGAARRFNLPGPLLLVAAGLAVSGIPGVPDYTINPDLVLPLVLPPLLHTAALECSYLRLRANVRSVTLLSVGYVLFSTLAVGAVAHWMIPGLPLTAALVLGAVVAPPDAVAATAIARRVGLPPRITTILQGESLLNDATAITAFRVAVAAAVGEGFSWTRGITTFLAAAVGGVAVGLVLTVPLGWLRRKLSDPLLQNTLSLLAPFAAYAAAEQVHASGVLAVVIVGLYLGHRQSEADFATRLQEAAVWKVVSFALESSVFALIGLQLRAVVRGLEEYGAWELAGYAAVVLAVLIVGRFVWVYPATYLPRLLSARLREKDPGPPWRYPFVVSWAGMRGVVSLAVAFSIPMTTRDGDPFPAWHLILFLTFAAVIGTLVVHGLTLPRVVTALRLPVPDAQAETLAEAQAQSEASRLAIARLDELLSHDDNRLPQPLEERLRGALERRQNAVWERLGAVSPSTGESVDATYRRLVRETVATERAALVGLRDQRLIDDEMLRTLIRRLDLEEALLQSGEDH